MAEPFRIECPCCGTRLTVDREHGEILSEERPERDSTASFEKALTEVRTGSRRREDAFTKAAERTRNLDDLLEKKFEEARRKAARDKGRPRSPFDAD